MSAEVLCRRQACEQSLRAPCERTPAEAGLQVETSPHVCGGERVLAPSAGGRALAYVLGGGTSVPRVAQHLSRPLQDTCPSLVELDFACVYPVSADGSGMACLYLCLHLNSSGTSGLAAGVSAAPTDLT